MTDLTDFLNVVASAEDWAGFGADGHEPEESMKRFTAPGRSARGPCRSRFIAG